MWFERRSDREGMHILLRPCFIESAGEPVSRATASIPRTNRPD